MAYPYDYDCDCGFDNENGYKGRQSEVLLNGERHDVYESVRHIKDHPVSAKETPVSSHRGALWLDQRRNEIYQWVGKGYKHDRVRNGWLPVFSDKFQITDEILNDAPSTNPVLGQLWLYGGVLLYYDGTNWQPVRTLEQSDSQFNVSMFSDFEIFAPLNRLGSAVISDLELETLLEMQRRYMDSDPDISTSSLMEIMKRWRFGDELPIPVDVVDFELDDVSYQYLVPNIDTDRVFIDGRLDLNYIRESRSVIQYKRNYLLDEKESFVDNTSAISHVKIPDLVHLNPGKLSNITKRIFKIDYMNPKIKCPAHNTEFYGFRAGDIHGHFLKPTRLAVEALYEYQKIIEQTSAEKHEVLKRKLKEMGYDIDVLDAGNLRTKAGDYEIQNDGIYLSTKASENYDYVLAITYEFSWRNATGIMRQADNRNGSISYYVPQLLGSTHVFVNGFDYEDTYYDWDNKNRTVTIAEDLSKTDTADVALLGVFAHEYGFIREMDMVHDNKSARIATIHRFLRPLIFVNGEVLCRSDWSYFDRMLLTDTSAPGNAFHIYNVHKDMTWSVIDMQKETPVYDEHGAIIDSTIEDICIEDNGIVGTTDEYVDTFGNRAIPLPVAYEPAYEDSDDSVYKRPMVVLFVNGLMVKREDIYYDLGVYGVAGDVQYRHITCEGLKPGMTYVLLDDRDGKLYSDDQLLPALSIGKLDATLVYHDGLLLNEPSSYLYVGDEGFAAMNAMHGEIRAFGGDQWKVFDTEDVDLISDTPGKWKTLDAIVRDEVLSFSSSYVNSTSSIVLSEDYPELHEGKITIFGFKLASTLESPLTPVNCWLHLNNIGRLFLKEAGYADEYIDLIENESANIVHMNKIDPTNPDVLERYVERNSEYYQFLFNAFEKWKTDTSIETVYPGWTITQQIEQYKLDSVTPPAGLPGYFYDGVYMTDSNDETSYIEIRDLARGLEWVNKVYIGKDFNPDTDYVKVWLNGVRQYPDTNYVIMPQHTSGGVLKGYDIVFGHYESGVFIPSVNDEGYIKTPVAPGNFTNNIPEEPVTGILTYIIYKPENGFNNIRYKVLTEKNLLNGSQNVYTTKDLNPKYIDPVTFKRDTSHDFSMYPGKVTVYADGVRLDKSEYSIVDNYTIVINSDNLFIGTKDTYPEQKYIDIYGQVKTRRRLKPEELLIEIQEDSEWAERTLEVNSDFYGDIPVLVNDSDLPMNILDTQDTLLIYVDGLYYGLIQNDGYVIDKTLGVISLRDVTVIDALKRDDIETYLVKYPEYYIWFNKEILAYRARKISKTHKLTIEWR